MKSAGWLLGCLALTIFIGVTVSTQLNTDASPATAFCAAAERQGMTCEVGIKYDSQVVTTDDGVGTQHAYLVVSQGSKVLTVITLQ